MKVRVLLTYTHTHTHTLQPVKWNTGLIPVSKGLQCQMMQRWKSERNTRRSQRALWEEREADNTPALKQPSQNATLIPVAVLCKIHEYKQKAVIFKRSVFRNNNFYKVFLSPCSNILHVVVFDKVMSRSLACEHLRLSSTPLSWYYRQSLINFFTCGMLQTGVLGLFHIFPSLLLPILSLFEMCC